jgi:hypothetical protein
MVVAARSNFAHARGVAWRHVEFVEQNAASFVGPDDVSVIQFYNPFVGETLASAVNRMPDSLMRRPRTIQIIFFNHGHFDRIVGGMDCLRRWALYETVPSRLSR